MTTEVGYEERAALAAMGYLERNDYSDIRQLDTTLIQAKDGTRDVVIWLNHLSWSIDGWSGEALVPESVVLLAGRKKARLDVITIVCSAPKQTAIMIRHLMNAVPE